MKPAAFAYAKAQSLEHAVALLGTDASARVLAGGQSLIATLNMRLDAPALLVDINAIVGLDAITLKDGQVEIGALVRHVDAERSPVIAEHAPLIAMAIPHIGHPAIRNRGTLAGSIAFADPAAELPACLVALDGEVEIIGPAGRRTVKADDFFRGLFETALGPRDVLTAIRFPAATPAMRYGFAELARRHGDYAIAGLRPARAPMVMSCRMCGWCFSASATRRCGRARRRRRSWRGKSMRLSARSRETSIRPTTCRRLAR